MAVIDELVELLRLLGYEVAPSSEEPSKAIVRPPSGRKAIFVGDLVDRGQKIPQDVEARHGYGRGWYCALRTWKSRCELMRRLRAKTCKLPTASADSLAQLEQESEDFRKNVAALSTT